MQGNGTKMGQKWDKHGTKMGQFSNAYFSSPTLGERLSLLFDRSKERPEKELVVELE
jgi:hypothetical protein